MKKLPRLYKNENINLNTNNIKSYHINNNDQEINIKDTINKIFNGTKPPYNNRVFIKTNSKEYNTYLISNKNNILTTIDNKKILIDEIQDIKIKN